MAATSSCSCSCGPAENAWASFRIDMLDSTDWKSCGRVLNNMLGYIVHLKTKPSDPLGKALEAKFAQGRDVRIVETYALDGARGALGGIDVVEVDDNGGAIGPNEFIAYEDIDSLGVY